jgi:hypothetical protein
MRDTAARRAPNDEAGMRLLRRVVYLLAILGGGLALAGGLLAGCAALGEKLGGARVCLEGPLGVGKVCFEVGKDPMKAPEGGASGDHATPGSPLDSTPTGPASTPSNNP